MNSNESKILKVINLMLKFVGRLNEEQLDDLTSGQAIFEVKSKKKVNTYQAKNEEKNNKKINNFDIILDKLNKSSDRNKASEYIKSLKLTNDKLILLGEELGIKIAKRNKKDKIISIIVEKSVGNKLKIEGLRKGIMGK